MELISTIVEESEDRASQLLSFRHKRLGSVSFLDKSDLILFEVKLGDIALEERHTKGRNFFTSRLGDQWHTAAIFFLLKEICVWNKQTSISCIDLSEENFNSIIR